MKKLLTLLFMGIPFFATAQEDLAAKANALVAEGTKLYKSEMASWHGTDLFSELYRDKEKVGGYYSYEENDIARCIFYNKEKIPRVLWAITFDSTFNAKTANVDITERDLTAHEMSLYSIRQAATAIIQTDTFFKTFENTNFNLIPIISDNEEKSIF